MSGLSDFIKEGSKKVFGLCLWGACFMGTVSLGFSAEVSQEKANAKESKPTVFVKDWKEVQSKQGKCTMSFPGKAEHISESMKIDEDGTELKYDAYIASSDPETVFMLLVALYPDFVDEEFAQMSLEAFLNGILSNGGGAQLLFADLVLVQGHEGMDFFIRTGANYFKGRALMVKNQLYLMAMECKVSDYDEKHYEKFVNSFLLHK